MQFEQSDRCFEMLIAKLVVDTRRNSRGEDITNRNNSSDRQNGSDRQHGHKKRNSFFLLFVLWQWRRIHSATASILSAAFVSISRQARRGRLGFQRGR